MDLDQGAECRAVLADGSTVDLRPIEPEDAEALRRFHRGLSPRTTYLRFFAVHPRLSPHEVDRFTHVDHREREAIVATCEGEIVGVARLDRLADQDEAEVAFVVADAWQGHGLGTVLFRAIARRARSLGVRTLVADTLADNSRMLTVFRGSGLPMSSTLLGGVVHLRMDLSSADSDG